MPEQFAYHNIPGSLEVMRDRRLYVWCSSIETRFLYHVGEVV